MYKKTGTIQVFDDLTLTDFNWSIHSVIYGWESGTATAEIRMSEGSFVHSRFYNFDAPGEWTSQSVIDAVMTLPQFSNSETL